MHDSSSFNRMAQSPETRNQHADAQPQNSLVLGLLRSCLQATAANAKLIENDPLVEWFQAETYVETYLDVIMSADEVAALRHSLVFLSGTPGSGKTQYIKKLRAALIEKHAFREATTSGEQSGTVKLHKEGHELLIKHDATQVDKEAENAATKLAELLAEDWCDSHFDNGPKRRHYLIGINQGVLQRLLAQDRFSHLRKHLADGSAAEQGILRVNLEKRTAVVPTNRDEAFVTKILRKLCSTAYWEDPPSRGNGFAFQTCHGCGTCQDSSCPIFTNVQRLRSSDAELRINNLFELNHYRSGQITTFRDVLAVLSKMIAGYHAHYATPETPCSEIRSLVAEGGLAASLNLSRLLHYNQFFSSADPWQEYVEVAGVRTGATFSGYAGPYFENETDGTCNMTRFDPMDSSAPVLRDSDDRVYNSPEVCLADLQQQSGVESRLALDLQQELASQQSAETSQDHAIRRAWLFFCLVRMERRRRLLAGPEPVFDLVPHRHAPSFASVITGLYEHKDSFRAVAGDLLLGLSGLSGVHPGRGMSLAYSAAGGPVTAALTSEPTPSLAAPKFDEEYVETYPRTVTLRIESGTDSSRPLASMEIDLDAWESLQRCAHGQLRDFLGTEYPLILEGEVEGLRAKAWALPSASLIVRDADSELVLRKAGTGVELY